MLDAKSKYFYSEFTLPWQPKYHRSATIHKKSILVVCYYSSTYVYMSTTFKV